MFTFLGADRRWPRRDVLRIGTLAAAGRLLPTARAAAPVRPKSVILVWLRGGASHIDSYDMKPDAPAEIRGEFKPARTNVPGIHICDLMPLQAKIMDRLAIVRGIKSVDIGDHTPHYILTGFPDRGARPVIGAVASRTLPRGDGMPPYVSLMYEPPKLYDTEGPTYLGNAHRPFVPKREGLANLAPAKGMSLDGLEDRKALLRRFDTIRRDTEYAGNMNGIDDSTRQALDMISSPKVRDAFDMNREPQSARERYGKYCENFLRARRLAEAGVSVITLKVGDWDTHEHNFRDHREQLPQLDRGIHALAEDLRERGLENDVAVVVWGEFGRDPRISRIAGRDHWPDAGAAVVFGGGFKMGQVIGETDRLANRSKGKPYTPSNLLASLYGFLGIDAERTFPDHAGRPLAILDDRDPIRELG